MLSQVFTRAARSKACHSCKGALTHVLVRFSNAFIYKHEATFYMSTLHAFLIRSLCLCRRTRLFIFSHQKRGFYCATSTFTGISSIESSYNSRAPFNKEPASSKLNWQVKPAIPRSLSRPFRVNISTAIYLINMHLISTAV